MIQKNQFFEECSWFKFSKLGMALSISGMVLKFYTSVGKGLKLKVNKFWKLISTFTEVYKTGRSGLFARLHPTTHPSPQHSYQSWTELKNDFSTRIVLCIFIARTPGLLNQSTETSLFFPVLKPTTHCLAWSTVCRSSDWN